jgi:hypothetical protein
MFSLNSPGAETMEVEALDGEPPSTGGITAFQDEDDDVRAGERGR